MATAYAEPGPVLYDPLWQPRPTRTQSSALRFFVGLTDDGTALFGAIDTGDQT